MAKHQKTLERIQTKPTPSDIRWDELKAMLQWLGFECLKKKGVRRKFYHRPTQALICCHQPHPDPCVDKGCIDDVVETLTIHGLI